MPQASDEDRAQMQQWFGDGIDDHGPHAYLESHGWTLLRGWLWQPPVPYHSVSCYELACVMFLINEWDYGGFKDAFGSTVCLCGQGMHK
jgi:hypothetical protein